LIFKNFGPYLNISEFVFNRETSFIDSLVPVSEWKLIAGLEIGARDFDGGSHFDRSDVLTVLIF